MIDSLSITKMKKLKILYIILLQYVNPYTWYVWDSVEELLFGNYWIFI